MVKRRRRARTCKICGSDEGIKSTYGRFEGVDLRISFLLCSKHRGQIETNTSQFVEEHRDELNA